jgi:hypothetical protein
LVVLFTAAHLYPLVSLRHCPDLGSGKAPQWLIVAEEDVPV